MNNEVVLAAFEAAQEVWPNNVVAYVDGEPWGFMIIDDHLQGAPMGARSAKERTERRQAWPDLVATRMDCLAKRTTKQQRAAQMGMDDAKAGRPYGNPYTYQPLEVPSLWQAYLQAYIDNVPEPETIATE